VAAPKKYPDKLRERAVRLYRESDPKPVIRRLAEQLGVHHEALRNWIRQDQADHGERHDRNQKAVNSAHARQRGPGERANAQLKSWRVLRKIRCCPRRITDLAKAVVVLIHAG
jgi:transposase